LNSIIYGRNPVMEALKSGRSIEKLLIQRSGKGFVKTIEAAATEMGVPIRYAEKSALDRETGVASHQGVAAFVSPYEYCDADDMLSSAQNRGESPFLLILDGVMDPRNFGAMLRTADGAGVHGVIIPKRRSSGLTDAAIKTAAGAAEYVPVARVANLADTVEKLKKANIWIAAGDVGGQNFWEVNLDGPVALIMGGEGKGVSRLLREKSDYIVSIPMEGQISSLNVSCAAAVLMYEINRQRKGKKIEG
jgi:23S rRNA (guanosine2251-2'-O)-methyltransferase